MRRRANILLSALVGLTAADADAPVVPATDRARLAECTGEVVTVEGQVGAAGWGKGGRVLTVEFAGTRAFLATAAFKSKPALDAAFDGDVAAAVRSRTVRLTGRIARYRGFDVRYDDALTMTLATPDQIVVVGSPATQRAGSR